MAGKLRIKISSDHVEPFWMFVDCKECPYIVDIQQKIGERMRNVTVSRLYLDGCLLPAYENSQVLRDNDVVNVQLTQDAEYEDKSAVSSSCPHKKQKKKKHLDNDSPLKHRKRKRADDEFSAENQVEQNVENREVKKKKKSRKEQYDPVVCELFDTGHKSQKKKEKKHKEKIVTEQDVDSIFLINENGDATEHAAPVANKMNEVQNENNIKTFVVSEKSPEEALATSSVPVNEIANSAMIEKKKRKRRSRKKVHAKNQPEARQDSTRTTAVAKPMPAELRLPKWQKGKNKRIVFSSDEESLSGPVVSSCIGGSKDVRSQTSSQPSLSSYNSSFSESFPANSSPNNISQTAAVDSTRVGIESSSTTANKKTNEGANGSVSVETENCSQLENGDDEWYRNRQYQGKLIEEQKLKRKSPSALDKALNPVHLYTGGRHEVVEPNLAEYLKMSPEERGAEIPPYVTATRLSSGTMVYTRSRYPVAVSSEDTNGKSASPLRSLAPSTPTTASPFKTPGAPVSASPIYRPGANSSAQASPQELGRQHLDTINNDKSTFVQNSPHLTSGGNAQETGWITNRTNVSEQEHETSDNQETIVMIPLSREYSLFADLTAAPKVGDTIAYKVLEMGEDYTPGMSDYKEAEVLAYDASSQNVTVKLLPASSELARKRTPGRFDMPDEEPVEDNVTLELSSMFESKLISSQSGTCS